MRYWRYVAVFLIGGVAGTAFGVAVGFFAFPFVFPPPAAVETIAPDDRGMAVATGTFIHANPNDPIHKGSGKVTVYARAVFLERDFEAGPGPDFRVLLVPKAAIRASSDVPDTMYVDLGGFRAFKGSQRYEVPEGVNLANYPSVVIWCRTFGVLISPADLSFGKPAT